jgi:hypothetical protein
MQADKVPAAMRALKSKLPPAVTARDILRQAHRDLFDKEVQHTYTTSYVWMTNQVSHFGLGFLATFVIVWIVQIVHALCACGLTPTGIGVGCAIEPYQFIGGWMLLVPALEVTAWAVMEYNDYGAAKHDAKGNSFVFDGQDVAWDAFRALWFIAAGIAVAYLSFIAWTFALAAFVGGALVSLIPAGYWLSRKLCFQQAALPYLFRLADFSGTFAPQAEQGVATVTDYLTRARPMRHLLIFGTTGAGRTSLAVAIATEHTFAVRSARYLSWAKFVETAPINPEDAVQDGIWVWPWRASEIVILDDVVKVIKGQSETSPDNIVDDLRKLPPEVVSSLAVRQTIWVLGPDQAGWITKLSAALNIAPDEFCTVEVIPKRGRGKPRATFSHFSGS